MNLDLVKKYFVALNAEDWDTFPTLWTDHATFVAVGAKPRSGPDEIAEFFRGAFQPWTTHVDEPLTYFLAEDGSIAVSVGFTGVTLAGSDVTFNGVDIFTFEGNRISSLDNYYDLVLVRRLLATS